MLIFPHIICLLACFRVTCTIFSEWTI